MQTVTVETSIAAPPMRVFLLSLSMDLHVDTTRQTGERIIGGVSHGLIGAGESVTFEGRHFGLRLRHTSRITAYHPPASFEDAMTHGLFRNFRHVHHFTPASNGTSMRDDLHFTSPLGLLGTFVDRWVMAAHLRRFLTGRNLRLKAIAESSAWTNYIPEPLQRECHQSA